MASPQQQQNPAPDDQNAVSLAHAEIKDRSWFRDTVIAWRYKRSSRAAFDCLQDGSLRPDEQRISAIVRGLVADVRNPDLRREILNQPITDGKRRWPLLHRCVKDCSGELILKIVEAGADLTCGVIQNVWWNSKDGKPEQRSKWSPLHLMVERAVHYNLLNPIDPATIDAFLQRCPDKDPKDAGGCTPLYFALHKGDFDVASLLIHGGASLGAFDGHLRKALTTRLARQEDTELASRNHGMHEYQKFALVNDTAMELMTDVLRTKTNLNRFGLHEFEDFLAFRQRVRDGQAPKLAEPEKQALPTRKVTRITADTAKELSELSARSISADDAVQDEFHHRCLRNEFKDGAARAESLQRIYRSFVRLLDKNAASEDQETAQYRELTERLYKGGLLNLERAYDLFCCVHEFKADDARLELERLQQARANTDNIREQQLLDRQLETQSARITRNEALQQKLWERLATADQIEADLESALGSLADIGIGDSARNGEYVYAAEELRRYLEAAVESARELEALRRKHL